MNIIVTVNKSWGIGKDNNLLFNFNQSKNFLKEMTTDKIVVMGRNTFENIYNKKPFKRRINICLTNNESYVNDNITVINSLDDLFEKLSFFESDNIFVVGGEETYKTLLPYCKVAYVTKVEENTKADAFFENLDKNKSWKLAKTSDPYYEQSTIFYTCKYVNSKVKKYNYGYIKKDLF